ncbi:type IV pilus biogenesis protein PilM [Pantoea anthophila]|uniref:Pilus assembly protein HofM n=1 Tax=Pantoea anthophila TaxID=470931 RepID=A0ABY2Z1J9_9GAMM|nr:pilus assembly protein PilM [Pantoea anthophila]TPV20953.1 pilus assembly protein HofM [Pantoea anthophila]WIM54421.1 pilus assembly protein PilM [Pantoea anthophila]
MAFHTWQIGLDIQNRQMCGLALQRRRDGWQLRHWWLQRLPQDTLRNGVLQSSPELQAVLTAWRQQLPRRYSLRVGFPARLVLQRPLPLPAQSLREPALGHYVQVAARRLFPLEPDTLALDYHEEAGSRQLCVTAARRESVDQWMIPLLQAGFRPQVLELTTDALKRLARQARLPGGTVLVLQQEGRWLWSDAQTAAECDDATTLGALKQQAFPHATAIAWCAATPAALPADTVAFSPFDLLRYQQPPLPANPGAFALATGLALTSGDEPAWR